MAAPVANRLVKKPRLGWHCPQLSCRCAVMLSPLIIYINRLKHRQKAVFTLGQDLFLVIEKKGPSGPFFMEKMKVLWNLSECHCDH
jgi:hypothetical protein